MRIPARLLLGVGVILALTALLYLAWATDFTGLLWAMPKQAWLLAEERDRERDLAVQSDTPPRRGGCDRGTPVLAGGCGAFPRPRSHESRTLPGLAP